MAKKGLSFAFSDPKRAPACKKYTTVCWVNIWTATKSHEHLNKLTLRCDKNKNKLFWKVPRDLTLILDPTTWRQKSDLTYPRWLNGKARQWSDSGPIKSRKVNTNSAKMLYLWEVGFERVWLNRLVTSSPHFHQISINSTGNFIYFSS